MNLKFLLYRLATLFAVLSVIGIVAWLFVLEGRRDDGPKVSNNSKRQQFDSAEETIEKGTADDILIRVNQLPPIVRNASYIDNATKLNERILLFQGLVDREDELEPHTQEIAYRGLLKNQLELHTLNLFQNVDDVKVRNTLQASARGIINAGRDDLSKDAQITLTAISVLELFDGNENEEEVQTAKSAINDMMRSYPNDKEAVNSLYYLLTQFGTGANHGDRATALLEHMNTICLESPDSFIREIGHAHRGRLLMIKHQLLNLNGQQEFYRGDEKSELLRRVNNFFAEDYTMNLPVSQAITSIGMQLEKWNENSSALSIYRQLAKRFEETEVGTDDLKMKEVQQTILDGIRRMEAKGKMVNLPDTVPNKNSLVMFVNNSEMSLQSTAAITNLRVISANEGLRLIVVSFEEDPSAMENYIQQNELKGLVFVSDPDKTSAYYKFYPAVFKPSVIIIGRDGTAIDVNVNLDRLAEFVKDLIDNE
jgi:hypothetical protein